MGTKGNWSFSKIAGRLFLLVVIAGVLILSVSAIGNQEKDKLTNIQITIKGDEDTLFITQKDIMSLLEKAAGKSLKDQPTRGIDLSLMEKKLQENNWIRDAELFIDNSNTLHVNIRENSPVARVFTKNGNSFYVSSTYNKLPLIDRVTVRLPVFTDYPGSTNKMDSSDSLLLNQIGTLSIYILKNDFWMSQIDQIDINPSGEFTLIPKLGNQVINFGGSDNYQEKFNKLLAFYKQVQTKVGWNYYSTISLQFEGQIVAQKRDAVLIKTDSIAAIKIMKNLIKEAKDAENDTTQIQLPVHENTEKLLPLRSNDTQEIDDASEDVKPVAPVKNDHPSVERITPVITKSFPAVLKEDKKQKEKVKVVKNKEVKKVSTEGKRVPKAVMPVKNSENEQNN